MGKGIRNRRELREQYDAAERREGEEAAEETEETDEDEDEEEEEEAAEGGDEEAAGAGDDDDEGGDDDDEDKPKPKKKKAPAKPKAAKAKPRSRAAKVVRMKVVWKVFNNSNNEVATYDYPKRKDAYEHAARLTTDKKQTHFVQPVKVAMDEKKEEKESKK